MRALVFHKHRAFFFFSSDMLNPRFLANDLFYFLQVQKYMNDAVDKAKRANELQAQIQARLSSLANLPAPMKNLPTLKTGDKPDSAVAGLVS